MRPHCVARGAAILGLLTVVFTACGGSDDDNDNAANDGAAGTSTSATDAAEQAASTLAPPSDDPDSSQIDACSLLTDAQVQAATGWAVANKHSGGGQGFATGACGWELESETAAPGVPDFTVSVLSPGGLAQFDILAGEMPAISGLGDAAYQQGDSIWAVTGDSLVVLDFSLLTADVDDPLQSAESLVGDVLAAL